MSEKLEMASQNAQQDQNNDLNPANLVTVNRNWMAPACIQHVYPEYSANLLKVMYDDYLGAAVEYLDNSGRKHYSLQNSFLAEPLSKAQIDRIRNGKVCCMSLFFKPTNINKHLILPLTDEAGQITENEIYKINHPIFENSYRYSTSFFENYVEKVLASDFGDWIPLVYLASDLESLAPLMESKGWIVIRMKHNSVAHSPGAMWRYLGLNLPCRYCYFQDTDRPFYLKRADFLAGLLGQFKSATLVRALQTSAKNGEMALILGNDFAVRPGNMDFDAAKMMLGYLTLNILHEDRVNNFAHETDRGRNHKSITSISQRMEREHFGPLPHERVHHKCFPYYCFDEQWLKEFIYYQFKNGAMITVFNEQINESDKIQKLDLEFQRKAHNPVITVKNGVVSYLNQLVPQGQIEKTARPNFNFRKIRDSSYQEYAKWYLLRQELKGERFNKPTSDEDFVQMMSLRHGGKIRDYFLTGKWQLGRIESEEELGRLIFLDDTQTRDEGLIKDPWSKNFRLLKRVAKNALEKNYLDQCASVNLVKYYRELRNGSMTLNGMNRLVLCEPNWIEIRDNPLGTYYLQDGTARALAYMMLILERKIRFQPVEVYTVTQAICN